MAKYVCDFEQVNSIAEKVCQAVSDMESALTTYSSNIDNNLSSWSGDAKTSFTTTSSTLTSNATSDLEYINSLGEFIKSSSQAIQKVEEELANINI